MVEEVELAPRVLVPVALGLCRPRVDDTVEIGRAGEGIEQDAVDQAEDRGGGAQGERQRRHRRDRECLLPQQAPDRMTQIHSRLIDAQPEREPDHLGDRRAP